MLGRLIIAIVFMAVVTDIKYNVYHIKQCL